MVDFLRDFSSVLSFIYGDGKHLRFVQYRISKRIKIYGKLRIINHRHRRRRREHDSCSPPNNFHYTALQFLRV